jgi:molecular chaperone DnaK
VGQLAKRQSVTNPQNTIYGVKRYMGHAFSMTKRLQNDISRVAFKIDKDAQGGVTVKLGEKNYRPEEVSAMILAKNKD